MTSYENYNSEKYIPEKDVKEAILIKTPRPEHFDSVKKLDDNLQERLKQKKRSQDSVIDNILEKVQDKLLNIMGPLSKLWVMIEQVNSGSGSSSTVEMDTALEPLQKQCYWLGNAIIQIQMKEGKMFYWMLQGPPHHKWLQCLKKRQHSYKNTIRHSLEKISETI